MYKLMVRQAIVVCIVFGAVMFLLLDTAFGQQNVQPNIQSSSSVLDQTLNLSCQSAALPNIVNLIALQTHLNFVIDGQPRLKSVDFSASGKLRDVIDSLADRFDYTWKMTASGVVIMTKRFKDPEELPQIHYAEMRKAAKDIVTALNALPYDANAEEAQRQGDNAMKWPQMLNDLGASLDAKQLAVLQSGGRLAAVDLSAQQTSILDDAIYTNCFGDTRFRWADLLSYLNNLHDGYLLMDMYTDPKMFNLNLVDKFKRRTHTSISIYTSVVTVSDGNVLK